ncbi:MAG: hypothetical protein NT004_00860 [Bacteroidetes bacterium]|nr:hypothetical protein [Bacteroidota bacterium]
MNQQYYYYKAFGLVFKSCIEHPDFIAEAAISEPDCLISFGSVPHKLNKPDALGGVYQLQGRQFFLRIENVGRYLIENGDKITIERLPGATDREIIVFLWASAVAALLHQRGKLIVHGSSIMKGENAIIFSGPSGSGKSTIASIFATRKGAMIISDDISAISYDPLSEVPFVLPGYPLMKLWRDSSDKLGLEWDDSRLIRDRVNKMMVNINDKFVNHSVPLRQFYLLSYINKGPGAIREVNGYKKLELLTGKIFRKNYLKKQESGTIDIFTEASKILPKIRICTLQRLLGIGHLDETIEMIEQDLMQSGIISGIQ